MPRGNMRGPKGIKPQPSRRTATTTAAAMVLWLGESGREELKMLRIAEREIRAYAELTAVREAKERRCGSDGHKGKLVSVGAAAPDINDRTG